MLSFKGKIIYPENIDQEKEFDNVSKVRRQSARFSFYNKGLKNGDEVVFCGDKISVAIVCGERDVEYEGQIWKLSPLTDKLYQQMGRPSGTYQGAAYFEYKGKKLKDLPDTIC